MLLKVIQNNTSCYGQEIELIDIKDFCKEYDDLFIAYPYRKKWHKLEEIENLDIKYVQNEKYYYDLIEYYFRNFSKKWFSIDKRYNILLKIYNTYKVLVELLEDDEVLYDDKDKRLLWLCSKDIIEKHKEDKNHTELIKRFNIYEYVFSIYEDVVTDFIDICNDNYCNSPYQTDGKFEVCYTFTNKGYNNRIYFYTLEGCRMFIYKLKVIGITNYPNYCSNYCTKKQINKIKVYHNNKKIKAFEHNENIIGNTWFNKCHL
jgi:hypothetical protein